MRAFYVDAAEDVLAKLPFDDSVLNNAKFLNFTKKTEFTYDSVKFFFDKYCDLQALTPTKLDELLEQFVEYQLLDKSIYLKIFGKK